jgi:hypothetical protein
LRFAPIALSEAVSTLRLAFPAAVAQLSVKPMRRLEDFMNALTDMDGGWWPVLSVRPKKSNNIDNTVLLKITAVFGTVLGLVFCLFYMRKTTTASLQGFAMRMALAWFIYFLGYKFTFAYFWNQRAKRLRDEKGQV